jgi:hypothetical protein
MVLARTVGLGARASRLPAGTGTGTGTQASVRQVA